MKRRWISSGLAGGLILGAYALHGAPPHEESSRPAARRHNPRPQVESPGRMSDSRSRSVSRSHAEAEAFDGKLIVASLASDKPPMLLEQARFEEFQGRIFLVGKQVKATFSVPMKAESHVAWDSVQAFCLFENVAQYEAAMRNALEGVQDTMSSLFDGSDDQAAIRTVHVPMIDLNNGRCILGEWLTEAVVKQIEAATPFKVLYKAEADSVLACTVESDVKQPALETSANEKPAREIVRSVRVQWTDRRGAKLQPEISVPLPTFEQSANIFPEFGQSLTSADQQKIERLARQIVEMMETSW